MDVPDVKIGVTVPPQHESMAPLRSVWHRAEDLRVDSLWTWDYFYPLFGEPDGMYFEGLTTRAAMAEATENPVIGSLVACNSYRNLNLTADMARTIDHVSGGRFILGKGSGWASSTPFPSTAILRSCSETGEKVTLRLRAEHPDVWNGFGDPAEAGRLNCVLDEWCAKVGCDPKTIERSILVDDASGAALSDEYLDNGITHVIFGVAAP